MDLLGRYGDHRVGGRRFETISGLEDACFNNPDLADEVDEVCCAAGSRAAVITYFTLAGIEYGDGNTSFCNVNDCGLGDDWYDEIDITLF